jgi:pSer/pThr/pTyr-binding forkhead associated (FHA) protein
MTSATVAARVPHLVGLVPEQIAGHGPDLTSAALADQWARLHTLSAITVIGRDTGNALAVLQTSVSRYHAELRLDVTTGRWSAVDLGSRNGTFLEGARLQPHTPCAIGDRQLLLIGEVGLVFVLDRHSVPSAGVTESYRATEQSARGPDCMRMSPPTIEGNGMVSVGNHTITLGSAQFALLWMLAERAIATRSQPIEVRGYVRSIELLTALPWNTAYPDDNHLKQQVRRVRRALVRLGLIDVIEARHGFGYRLTIEPLLGA